MRKYTKSKFMMHPCKLERDDLLKLVEIVKEAFPVSDRKEDFEIYTNLPNISIRENSVEGFLEHGDLPDKLNRLSIDIIGWSEDREIDKSVRMTFYDNYIEIKVDGADQTWVLGKYSQIREFLKDKKPWFWPFYILGQFSAGIILGSALVVLLYILVYFIKAKEIIYSASMSLFLMTWIAAVIFYFKGTFLPYTQILLNDKKSVFSRENVTIIIALLSLIVSAIGVIKSFLK